MLDVPGFMRLCVDPVRLAILGAAAVEPVDAQRIAAARGVALKKVQREIGRLTEVGLLAEGRLVDDVLRSLAQSLPQEEGIDPSMVDGPWSVEESRVLTAFFSGRRLREIPSQHSKRLVVLERLVQDFEPGVRYDEREVNFMLQMYHPDHAALRRYLVDEGFLTRADGVYWRTGGRM
jgi:hypothetical protein